MMQVYGLVYYVTQPHLTQNIAVIEGFEASMTSSQITLESLPQTTLKITKLGKRGDKVTESKVKMVNNGEKMP